MLTSCRTTSQRFDPGNSRHRYRTRDPQYLDWTLPDPARFISGKHCEIRWHDGAHWLHDVSTNGTFIYGANGRMKAPHKLRDGDRFLVGHYIILAGRER